MCGFVGRLNLENAPHPEKRVPLTSALQFLKRRGPDGWHFWRTQDFRLELLHARLAIVDPDERARQPFTNSAGLTVVFNGEIYNYEELRKDLGDSVFHTTSDTEVLLAAFARWGVAGLKRLRGMFAGVIVDPGRQRIFLVRDPIGKKPLYWARWTGGVWFGSSVLALAATCDRLPLVREEVLKEFWRFSYVPPNESLFAGCAPVTPGEVIELDFDGADRGRASCRPDPEPVSMLRLEEVHERLAELCQRSVMRRLHNNPRPVSLLSGGIDSTVVTRFMSVARGGTAITLRSVIPFTLDEKYARYAARHIDIPVDLVSARLDRLEEEVSWAIDLQDEPLGMISFFPLTLLIKRAKAIGKILLTGDGADEIFMGYGWPNEWTDPGHGTNEYSAPERKVQVGLPAPEWVSPWGRWCVGHSLLGHMFTKVDRASAEQGVEVRCPLVDWDLVAFVRSLPPEQLFYSGRPKSLLKAQLSGWPAWFVERRKLGFPYHLRWAWAIRRFAGLRDMVAPESVAAFGEQVPNALRIQPRLWSSVAILKNFAAAWKLLTWSGFAGRLKCAEKAAGQPERPDLARRLETDSVEIAAV
jgi:asparagine synthase (glutamine-hydrolysing)